MGKKIKFSFLQIQLKITFSKNVYYEVYLENLGTKLHSTFFFYNLQFLKSKSRMFTTFAMFYVFVAKSDYVSHEIKFKHPISDAILRVNISVKSNLNSDSRGFTDVL